MLFIFTVPLNPFPSIYHHLFEHLYYKAVLKFHIDAILIYYNYIISLIIIEWLAIHTLMLLSVKNLWNLLIILRLENWAAIAKQILGCLWVHLLRLKNLSIIIEQLRNLLRTLLTHLLLVTLSTIVKQIRLILLIK